MDGSGKILAKEKYLLSLKDLNLSDYLRSLINAGVSSFKIEGRLKDINYVKNVTAFYRQRIDEILNKDSSLSSASSGRTIFAFHPDPSRTFNRGLTDYFINGRKKDILSSHTPKSVGACLGKAGKVGRNYFILETPEALHNGDGICFFNRQEILCGANINKVEGNKVYPSELEGIEEGTMVYRNYDYKFAKTLQGNKTKRLIKVKLKFEETENGFMLGILDEDGIEVSVVQKAEKIPAKSRLAAEETVRRQLLKLGDSIFDAEDINISWSRPYFIPVSICNKLRREAVGQLDKERCKRFARLQVSIIPNNVTIPGGALGLFCEYCEQEIGNVLSQAWSKNYRTGIRTAAE